MQSHTITQYQTFGPGLDTLTREIESILQVYTEVAVVLAVVIMGVVACLLLCEMKQSGKSKTSSRRRPLAARELSDTGF